MRNQRHRLGATKPRGLSPRATSRRCLAFEAMERRDLLATIVVQPASNLAHPVAEVTYTQPIASFTTDATTPTIGNFAASIDWGDGTAATPGTIAQGAALGTFNVVGTHVYQAAGAFNSRVQVTDATMGAAAAIVPLEVDPKVQAVAALAVAPNPVAGSPFTRTLAAFAANVSAGAAASDFAATVQWGDGTTSATSDASPASVQIVKVADDARFVVVGTHAYATSAAFSATVSVADMAGGSLSAAVPITVDPRAALTLTPTPIVPEPVANVAFTRTVATFATTAQASQVSDFRAEVDWGDGTTSAGTITPGLGVGRYAVGGTHTYLAPGSYAAIVRVADTSNSPVAAPLAVTVAAVATAPPVAITGGLATASALFGGALITNVNRPTFEGTTTPYAIVQVFGQRGSSWPTDFVAMGQAIADASGRWSVVSAPLLDGLYAISATTTAPGLLPSPPVALLGGSLVIDTIPPRVRALHFDPRTNQITLAIQDTGSGIDDGVLLRGPLYTFTGPSGLAGTPVVTVRPIASAVSGFYSNARAVTLTLGAGRAQPGHYRLQVASGGLVDRAGNPLDGEFRGRFPSGNGKRGGNFLARFAVPRPGRR